MAECFFTAPGWAFSKLYTVKISTIIHIKAHSESFLSELLAWDLDNMGPNKMFNELISCSPKRHFRDLKSFTANIYWRIILCFHHRVTTVTQVPNLPTLFCPEPPTPRSKQPMLTWRAGLNKLSPPSHRPEWPGWTGKSFELFLR